jgi:hypothetical protein
MAMDQAAARNAAVSVGGGMPDLDQVRARHPERVIRREGFMWVATDPEGVRPPLESARLDFLDALLDETGASG